MHIHSALPNGISSLTAVLWLALAMVLGYFDGVLGDTTKSSSSSTTSTTDEPARVLADDKSGMIKGMAAGFGGFFAILALVCILWCCCCGNDDSSSRRCCCKKEKHSDKSCPVGKPKARDRSKIAPSPPQSEASWSRSH